MIYTQKVKLLPDKQLECRLNDLFEVQRFTYNYLLGSLIQQGFHKNFKPFAKQYNQTQKDFRFLNNEKSFVDHKCHRYDDVFYSLLKNAPSAIVDNEIKYVKHAFDTLKRNNLPSFKKKHTAKKSFTLHKKVESTFKYENGILTIAKMSFNVGKLRFLTHIQNIKIITVSKNPYGYYISVTYEISDMVFSRPQNGNIVGIDWGILKFASDSDGNQHTFKQGIQYQRYLRLYNLLKILQVRLSLKQLKNKSYKTSKSYEKLRDRIAKMHMRLANIRKNFLHHLTKHYTDNSTVIKIEDLKPRNLLKNHKLARTIAESMFYTWKVMLEYKAKWKGCTVILVSPHNTSKICSNCKTLGPKIGLSTRLFSCNSCGHILDRDLNAAINIKNA